MNPLAVSVKAVIWRITTNVELKFNSKETPTDVYNIKIKNMEDCINLAHDDYKLLERMRFDLDNYLAKVRNLQAEIKYGHMIRPMEML